MTAIWLTTIGELLIIELANSSTHLPELKSNRFVTTKKRNPEIHGFGIESVRQVVKKFNGTVNFEYDETYFNVKVVLNNMV